MRGDLHFDAVVIGAGNAGLTAATRLAEGGARVCVLAKGIGSTHLAPGTVDVLGYAPDRVEEPARALSELVAARPDHPYALMGVESVAPALQWFAEHIANGPQPGYRYVGDLERNHLLTTAVGVLRPSALVPETMAEGDMRVREPVCIVGTRALRDFHAALCAANLRAAGIAARAIEVDLELDRADANALGIARRFDDPDFRAAFAAAAHAAPAAATSASGCRPCSACATRTARGPTCSGAWDAASSRSRPCRRRCRACAIFEALRAALRAAGGRLILGSEVIGAERDGARISAVRAHAAGHDVRYHARWFVLATGGFASGAIALGSDWITRETVLGLPLRGVPGSRRAALRGLVHGRAADGAGGGGRRRRAARRGRRERARRRRLAARRRAVAGGLGRGHRAVQRPPRRGGRAGRERRA